MRMVHVLRKPLSEGTVAANTLKHGTGGLNIDASRVSGDGSHMRPFQPTNNDREVYGAQAGFQPTNHKGGRWPANLILQHLDGCRCAGVKKVKGSFLNHECTDGDLYGKYASVRKRGHTDKDGKETVANWLCEPGCPVARLDEQSGVFAPQGGQKHKDTKEGSFLETGFGGSPTSTFYGDTGGASRFYKQIGGKADG